MVCRACGYDDQQNQVYCTLCGTLFNETAPDKERAPENSNLLLNSEGQGTDLYLTLHIGEIKLLMPFPAGVELTLGRGGETKTATIVNPVHNLYPRQGGELFMLDDLPRFLNLAPYGAEKSGVSRKHARLCRTEQGLMVEDLASTNGTRVNNELVRPGQKRLISSGDIVTLSLLSIKVSYYAEISHAKYHQNTEGGKPPS